MELLYKNKIIDYIRANIDYNDMQAHIRKSMNADTLAVFANFLNIDNKLPMMTSDIFTIKHELLFLVYKECLSIYEAYAIISQLVTIEIEEVYTARVKKMLDDLFVFVCIELKLYTGDKYTILYNNNTIFNKLSKIFIANLKYFSYSNIDDLNVDLAKLLAVPKHSEALQYINTFNLQSEPITPFLSGDNKSSLLGLIGIISYAYTLAETLKKDPNFLTNRNLIEDLNSITLTYTANLRTTNVLGEYQNMIELVNNSCMVKEPGQLYGKYQLFNVPNLPIFLDNCINFLNLCENVRNRMISYAII